MYLVVVCSRCHRSQVLEARFLSQRCHHCGTSLAWKERKLFYAGDDPEEARRVAGRVALEAGGADGEAVAEATRAAERESRYSTADVVARLEESSEFGPEDVALLARSFKVAVDPDRLLGSLRDARRLYEPRPGRFRWLS